MPLPPSHSPTCPFCAIASPSSPSAHLILSHPLLLAFLDHAPISRGHVLLATRQHREKLSDVSVEEGRALGAWLGVLSRAVVGGAFGAGGGEEGGEGKGEKGGGVLGDWNVVQNNGARAAQVVPHVHFHIIPRPGNVPEIKNRSWTIFGRGQREDLDDDDAVLLVRAIRERLGVELDAVRAKEGEEAVRMLMGEGRERWKL